MGSLAGRGANSEVCPECGSALAMVEGCATCNNCGYSHCSV